MSLKRLFLPAALVVISTVSAFAADLPARSPPAAAAPARL